MNKKPALFNAFVLLAMVLSACGSSGTDDGVPTVDHASKPGTPVYSQLIWDCNTGKNLPADYSSDGPIQPDSGCDSWQINRYERPFNAETQDVFFPDLDILSGELGRDDTWFYFRMSVFDKKQGEDKLSGAYAIEIDLDMDGRGDVLVLATPSEEAAQDWSVVGVQFWGDSNNDVGNKIPLSPDSPYDGDGYDTLVFDQGEGSDHDLAWVRVSEGKPSTLEIAFKASAILYDPHFKWWAWTDEGVRSPSDADYHDTYVHEDAGDPIEGMQFFPSQSIHEVDNTCTSIWGAPPDDDPNLCSNDPSVPNPTLEPTFTPTVNLTPGGSDTPTPDDTTPTPMDITPTPSDDSPTPTPTQPTSTLTETATPCFDPQSTAPNSTCTPTPTASNTPTYTATVCFNVVGNDGQFIGCTPTYTATMTPTVCVSNYPFAVVDCTPTVTYTPTVTATICYTDVTTTPTATTTVTATSTTTGTPTSITAPNNPSVIQVPCSPTPTPTYTATVCAVGAALTNLVLCTPTATPTMCLVPDGTGTFMTCSPTPSPTICVVPDATGTFVQCTPGPQSAAMMVQPEQDTNCRRGPAGNTEIDDTLKEGEDYEPLGRTPDNLYMLFKGPTRGVRCWAASSLFIIPFGPLNQVPGSVLPYINYPTSTPTPTKVPAVATKTPVPVALSQCNDGIDNDGDGNIDYGPDKECSSPSDNDERR